MDISEMSFEYLNAAYSKIVSPFRLRRIDSTNGRMYASYNEAANNYDYYLSVTEFCSRCLPTSKHLKHWIGENGNDMAKEIMWKAAEYGTFLHIQIGILIKEGKYNLANMQGFIDSYLIENNLPIECRYEWYDKALQDIAAFYRFVYDKKIEFISCEFAVVSPKYGVGGCIDLVVKMMFNRKMVTAIIDIKSGRKGFYESHQLQLQVYKKVWNDIYGEICPVDMVFNWSPKDWNTKKQPLEPTYNFVNQTECFGENTEAVTLNHLERCVLGGWNKTPHGNLVPTGELDLAADNLHDCLTILNYDQALILFDNQNSSK